MATPSQSPETGVIMTITEMIEKAIGQSRGAGSFIDFNMLQAVLYCMAQQLRIENKKVDMRSNVGFLSYVLPLEGGLEVHELSEKGEQIKPSSKLLPQDQTTTLVVERKKSVYYADEQARAAAEAAMAALAADAVLGLPRETSLLDMTSGDDEALSTNCERIRKSINRLNEAFFKTTKRAGLQAQKPKGSTIVNGLPMLALTQKVIEKGTKEEIAQHVRDLREDLNNLNEAMYETMRTYGIADLEMDNLRGFPEDLPHAQLVAMTDENVEAIIQNITGLRDDVTLLNEAFYGTMQRVGIPAAPDFITPTAVGPDGKFAGLTTASGRLTTASKVFALGLGARSGFVSTIGPGPPVSSMSAEYIAKAIELQRMVEQCCSKIAQNNSNLTDKMTLIEDRIDYVLKQMGINAVDLENNRITPDIATRLQGALQLNDTVDGMQNQIKALEEATAALAAQNEERLHRINTLLEQIELLKCIKMDREDVEEALGEKADLKQLATKVSRDLFEMTSTDLSKGLEHSIGKLNMLEALLHQALDDLQNELELKLNRVELIPVKNDFNARLDALQEAMTQLYNQKIEADARATTKKLLRDVNCMSCNANATIPKIAGPSLPGNDPLPTTKSIRPYVTTEMDAIRKTIAAAGQHKRSKQEGNLPDRHMLQRSRSDMDNMRICSRFCGGSHTKTTPPQRVGRAGNFAKQWGSDVIPMKSEFAAGDDGKMYKVVSVVEPTMFHQTKVEVAEKPMRISDAEPPSPTRPFIISNECKCVKSTEKGENNNENQGENPQ